MRKLTVFGRTITLKVVAGVGVGLLVMAAGAVAVPLVVAGAAHATAMAEASNAVAVNEVAAAQQNAARASLAFAVTDALEQATALGVVLDRDNSATFLGKTGSTALKSVIDELKKGTAGVATADPDSGAVTLISTREAAPPVTVDPALATAELKLATAALTTEHARIVDATKTLGTQLAGVRTAQLLATSQMQAVLDALPAQTTTTLAGFGNATAKTVAAFKTAGEAVTVLPASSSKVAAGLVAYLDAADALKASHLAETARIAATKANTGGGGHSGGSHSGGGSSHHSGGGSSHSGGGSSHSGGSSSHSGGSGSTAPPPPDTTRHVVTNSYYVSWPVCNAAGAAYFMRHDPGPGGTSRPSIMQPWSYQKTSTYINFYVCAID